MVLLAGTDKIDETPARPRIRVGASRPRPPRTSTARRDAPQADRLHHLDGRELATKSTRGTIRETRGRTPCFPNCFLWLITPVEFDSAEILASQRYCPFRNLLVKN